LGVDNGAANHFVAVVEKKNPAKCAIVTFQITRAQQSKLRRVALNDGRTVSSFIRKVILAAIK